MREGGAGTTHHVKATAIGNDRSDVRHSTKLERVTFLVCAAGEEIVRLRLPFWESIVDAASAQPARAGAAAGRGPRREVRVGEDQVRAEQLHGDLADLGLERFTGEELEHVRPNVARRPASLLGFVCAERRRRVADDGRGLRGGGPDRLERGGDAILGDQPALDQVLCSGTTVSVQQGGWSASDMAASRVMCDSSRRRGTLHTVHRAVLQLQQRGQLECLRWQRAAGRTPSSLKNKTSSGVRAGMVAAGMGAVASHE